MSETVFKHTVALRFKKEGQIGYDIQYSVDHPSREPLNEHIHQCDKLAKMLNDETGGWSPGPAYDGVIYKVDDSVEYFVSKYYFKYPNTTDKDEYGKSRHQRIRSIHRESVSGRRGEGDRKTQRRAA